MCNRIGENRYVRDTIEARQRAQAESLLPHPDQTKGSPSQDHFGPQAFGPRILATYYRKRFRPTSHIGRYDGETGPNHWFKDYRLTMRVGGADKDFAFESPSLVLIN